MSEAHEAKIATEKREYQSPKLISYGALRELTQNGTAIIKENHGQQRCGAGYDKSGPSSC
jgi:hypothetical protein